MDKCVICDTQVKNVKTTNLVHVGTINFKYDVSYESDYFICNTCIINVDKYFKESTKIQEN